MNTYIPADKLLAEIEKWSDGKLTLSHLTEIKGIITSLQQEQPQPCQECVYQDKKDGTCCFPYGGRIITYLSNGGMECNSFCRVEPDDNQQQPANMIQWTGQNLREVVSFTGKSPKFDEYFKSWEEFEQYVHSHGDIFKLFFEDGSHYEVPVGAWIVKTPDGYNVPSVARFVSSSTERQRRNANVCLSWKKFKDDESGVPALLVSNALIRRGGKYSTGFNIISGDEYILIRDIEAAIAQKPTERNEEQPEVDLEKEIETYFKGWYMDETDQGHILHTPDDHAGLMSVKQVARHFYELGLKARKEE